MIFFFNFTWNFNVFCSKIKIEVPSPTFKKAQACHLFWMLYFKNLHLIMKCLKPVQMFYYLVWYWTQFRNKSCLKRKIGLSGCNSVPFLLYVNKMLQPVQILQNSMDALCVLITLCLILLALKDIKFSIT